MKIFYLERVLLLFTKCCMDVLDKKLKKINDINIDDDQIIDLLVLLFQLVTSWDQF